MQETDKVSPSDELRQGDIISLENIDPKPGQETLGVIINADCDLAHHKCDGVIAYLPIFTFGEYIEYFWAPKYLEHQKKTLASSILSLCGSENEDPELLFDWLKYEEADQLTTKLMDNNSAKRARQDLTEKIERLRVCIMASGNPMKAISHFFCLDKKPDIFAVKQIMSEFKEMGDGHFFINEITGDARLGFVIRMRRICSLESSNCYRSRSQQLKEDYKGKASAYRIATLTPPFKFRLAQIFAYQFSRVGLPDEISELRSLVIEDAAYSILAAGEIQ